VNESPGTRTLKGVAYHGDSAGWVNGTPNENLSGFKSAENFYNQWLNSHRGKQCLSMPKQNLLFMPHATSNDGVFTSFIYSLHIFPASSRKLLSLGISCTIILHIINLLSLLLKINKPM
jgi:hypothetical protein